jgi:hypothetical protein
LLEFQLDKIKNVIVNCGEISVKTKNQARATLSEHLKITSSKIFAKRHPPPPQRSKFQKYPHTDGVTTKGLKTFVRFVRRSGAHYARADLSKISLGPAQKNVKLNAQKGQKFDAKPTQSSKSSPKGSSFGNQNFFIEREKEEKDTHEREEKKRVGDN